MSNILFLVHRIPFPPDKGDKIRSYHLLKFLSERHEVYLGAFVHNPEDMHHVADVRSLCADAWLQPIGRWRSRLAALAALLRGRSLSVGFFRDGHMKAWVSDLLNRQGIDAIVAFSSTMAQYVPDDVSRQVPVIADFVDVDSDKWRQYASATKWPMSLLYGYEAKALARWEASVLDRVDVVTVATETESRLLRSAATGKVRVIRNGVDLEFFDPDRICMNPYRGATDVVVFTGAMDYYANEDGVRWFADEIWPTVRLRIPVAEFWIVGSNPTAAVLSLAQIEGVKVTGRVADVRPYLRHAKVAVAPLRLARGVQNKVLEALAMNRPVVAAPQALQGLDGVLPGTIAEAASSSAFCEAVCGFLGRNTVDNGEAGRDYVRTQYDWYRNLSEFQSLIGSNCGGNEYSRNVAAHA